MEKLKLLICIFIVCSVSDIYSQVVFDSSVECSPDSEDCVKYEYFGDLNRNKKAHGKGRIVWENGGVTEGEWVNGNLIKGETTDPDGSYYKGEYKNKTPHGYGKKLWPSGSTYEGNWKFGKRHGKGVYIFQTVQDDLQIKEYRGPFIENKMTGLASIVYFNGSTYEGAVKEGAREGFGEYIYASEKKFYKGNFKKGRFHGRGTLQEGERITEGWWKEGVIEGNVKITYETGGVFQGYVKNGYKEGQGKETDPDGNSYSGGFKESKRHGFGTQITPDGVVLEGQFKNNFFVSGTKTDSRDGKWIGKFNKEGNLEGEATIMHLGNKEQQPFRMKGNFKNGVMSGYGEKDWTERYTEGDIHFRYRGEFKNNKFNGYGITQDLKPGDTLWGPRYMGNFKDNLYHGQGELTLRDKVSTQTVRGNFRNLEPHGKVVVDNRAYDGSWESFFVGTMKNGIMEGYGESIRIQDGITHTYKGDHRNNRTFGKGIVTLTDNETGKKHVREGNFDDQNRLNGNGSVTYTSGAQDSGYFEDGMLVNGTMTGALGLFFDTGPYRRGEVIIRSIREDGAAFDSGLMKGDKIIATKSKDSDWINLSDLNPQQQLTYSPLRVKNNSQLDLKIERENGNLTEEKVFSLTSMTLKMTPTKDESILENNPRVALVIGNGNYNSSSLENSINDAKLIKKSLDDKDFKTILKLDTDKEGFKKAIWEFGDLIEESGPNTTALFFYSGHGIQVNGKNYLIPLGVKIKRLREVEIEAISADEIMNALAIAEKGVKIMILDACRDNPFKSFSRNLVKGLAEMDSPTGTIIAYSTAPGRTALDGGFDYENSVYTKNLVESMDVYDLKIEEVFKKTRREVERTTEGEQVPWESSSLLGDFYFNKLN